MINLTATTQKLQAVLAGAITTNQLPVVVSYADDNATTYVAGTQQTVTNSTSAVDICAAPGASTNRQINFLNIRNRDTVAATVTVLYNDNATTYELHKATLAVGDVLTYTHAHGWHTTDTTGAIKASNGINALSGLSQFGNASTTSAQLAAVLSDETGTGAAVFANTPTLVTPVLGAATGTTFNGLTISTTTGTLTLANGSSIVTSGAYAGTFTFTGTTGVTFPTTGTLSTLAGTETLTNKRLPPRVGSTTSSATPTINTDATDIYRLTAQAVDITSFTTNLSGTPNHGENLLIEITGTAARAITWGASFEASTVALPTTTVSTNMLSVAFSYNSATSKWRCMGAV